jgi:fibronectin type 3 domain-containing protein
VAVVAIGVLAIGPSGAVSAPPDIDGQWSAPAAWPIVAVHMALQPNGKVLAFDGFASAPNSERLWDPATESFTAVPYGRNLFCAGHVGLSDGRTLILGGHITAGNGLADTTIFDSKANTWFRGPDMSVARWYPTVTELPDGRALVFSGDNIVQDRPGATPPFSDASVNSLPEIYDPKTNSYTDLTGARLTSPLYPFMFVLSDGRIFDAGPDTTTRVLNPSTWTWSTVGTSPIDGMSAVMYRPDKIMKSGSWADPDFGGSKTYNATNRTAVIDMSQGTPAWRETASMGFARAYHNLTLLADGTVLASGGTTKSDGVNLANAVLPAEIWNPDTETWTTVAPLTNGRLYHSTALLLPDARVLMAGGGQLPGSSIVDQKNAEIYSPPYLFKGSRPTISSTPLMMQYGQSFTVTTPDAGRIASISLIRTPSVTHAFDQDQRFMRLGFTAQSGSLSVTAPANGRLAPPGEYMLFLVDTNGVPSVASIMQVVEPLDTTAPTAPSGLSATGAQGSASLSWSASSDNVGVTRYNVHRSTAAGFTPSAANRVGQPAGTSFTDSGLASGTYYYKVTAEDASGNVSGASNQASATVTTTPPSGLVAAYSFDEGSGTAVADLSGKGNGGTISGATWTGAGGGKFGSALSFDGVNDWVTVADANTLDLTTGMTLEAWVNPSALGTSWRTAVFKETTNYYAYALYGNTGTTRPSGNLLVAGTDFDQRGSAALPVNAWSHIAATYDGASLRLYVNGTQVGTQAASGSISASTGVLRMGGNNIWAEWFQGLIDEVRVYNRALSATEIQTDMATSVGTPDAQAPTTPTNLAATGGLSSVALSWSASSDNVGVTRYNVHRGTNTGFTPSTANRVAQPTGTSYTDPGLAAGSYYYKVTAEDASGNVSGASNEASAAVTGDVSAPTAPSGLSATGAQGSASLSWTASTDNVGVTRYNVHRSTASGFTPSTTNRVGQPTGTSYTDSGLAAGTYYYKVTAEDASGNVSGASNQASATVTTAPPSGLVAAYSFDEGSGTAVADLSGKGNGGTISGATWTGAGGGKFGAALSFDGVNDWVTVADSNTLDLTSGMAVEAWVNPTALGNAWRTVLMKERTGNMVYDLYANGSGASKVPDTEVFVSGVARETKGTTALGLSTWTHLAATYDGASLRLFVNGTQVGTQAASGSISASTGALRMGGNNIWGEWYQGLIDEVRIYNRALSATEIQTDMATSVGTPDTQAPAAPPNLAAVGAIGTASLSWTASTDNVGVVRYNVHRSTTAGFTPSAANRIAQPTGTSYTDSGLAAGTYYYKATAEDAAGNISAPSGETSATVTSDTAPPSIPGNLTATPAPGQASLSWTASSDNVGVARYNVHRSTTAGFTASAANRIAQPTGTSISDTGLAAGTYYYKVTAEDASGNVSGASNEASVTITAALPVGLVAAYGFDESAGTAAADASGSGNGGTVVGPGWTIGKFGAALSFDGVNDWVTVADANSLDLTTGMTLEAWVFPTALGTGWRTTIFKEQSGNYAYATYANTGTSRPSGNAVTGGVDNDLRGSAQLALNTWAHLAATYDGSNLRLYVNAAQVGSQAASGPITASTGALRIGGNNIWPEWFQGRIDEIRVYNRALSATEIQTDMATGAAPDTRNPSVSSVSPADGASNVPIDSPVKATFNEAMDPASITTSSFAVRDASGNVVPATVSYDSITGQATLKPTSALIYGTTYTVDVKSGATGVKDLAGRSMSADKVWSFSTEPAPPPIAVITSSANRYTSYLGEILRAEGFSFATLDVSLMSPAVLGYYDAVVLGEMPLSASQVTMLSNWVTGGGNLIAMRPDKQLAGLLGLTDAGAMLANGYLLANAVTEAGAGIVNQTIQFHGTADRYALNGATGVATLYSSATAATANPAVTNRSVGASGGQAAAFTYDLARSVILTRQGNPAWAGQDRDAVVPIRPNDLFFGAATGDVQPDWVDTSKIGIPQADEQQRLLANLIITMSRDRKPVPHFWYFPRDEKAAIVMSGDDHAFGGTAGRFDRYKALSPSGCSVALWECVRSTSYIYPASPLTNAQAAGYVADGFEVSVHVTVTGGLSCGNWTPSSLEQAYAQQLASFAAKYTSVPAPITHRAHCVSWSDWATQPKTELAHGIRLDTNYYHYPDTWIGSKPGFMTGSGMAMRFADTDGTAIDEYQAHTEMTDESGQAYPATVDALLNKALGPEGYYGFFVANIHTDQAASTESDAVVSSALARSVPVISAKQLLDWVDGRNASQFRSFSWSGNILGFSVATASGATGLQVMLPAQSAVGSLTSVTRGGNPVVFTRQTIKGIEYALFSAADGAYSATYG